MNIKKKIGKIALLTAGALEKNSKITEGYKIGEFNEYYLTLNNGQTVVIMERNDGTMIFESIKK